MTVTNKANKSNIRIDKYLAETYLDKTRNYFIDLIKKGFVKVNNNLVKSSYIIKEKDVIEIEFLESNLKVNEKKEVDLNIKILYEDKYLAIINKPKGIVTHPADSYEKETLVNGLRYLFKDNLSNINSDRPGIVHRLDKDTSGALIIAKDNLTHEKLSSMFKKHIIVKGYIAIVEGKLVDNKIINLPIKRSTTKRHKMEINPNGRESITEYKVISYNNNFSLLDVLIKTGRTHQIRCHMQAINHPIIGDKIYGAKKTNFDFFYLHSYKLEFIHPMTNENIKIILKPEKYFLDKIKELNLECNLF